MKQFFVFIRKEAKHILRDVYTLVVLLIMPISLLLILGYAISMEIKNTPFVVVDNSQSELSRKLIEKIDANEYFSLVSYYNNQQEVDNAFRRGKSKLALIFPSDFETNYYKLDQSNIQSLIDASDPNEAATINNYLQLIINQFEQEQSPASNLALLNVEVKMLYNPQMKSSYNFVPGLMGLLLMLICAMMTSVSIVREKELGTMEILLISPLRPAAIVLAKAIPYFVISMIDVVLILVIAHFLMAVPIVGNLITIFILSVVFTLSALSLGMLISSITSSQQLALIMSVVGLMLPSMLLSGVLFPIESMPVLLQALSNIVPARWFIAAIRGVMIKGLGIASIWKEVAVLTAMTVFLLFVSVKKFKNRL